ncbi:MAG: NAD-dependent succinate-semialdehyde dehydrogenase [Gemmatimonadota bacterium]
MSWTAVNPATGETLKEYPELTREELEAVLQEAHQTQKSWRSTPYSHRADRLRRAAALLRERVEEHALLMTQEMGKPLSEARGEVEKCAWVCEYYADNGEDHLAPETVDTPDTDARTYVAFQPIGLVLAIMPWNFPYWQVFRFAAPNLMAGNGGILKHAPNVPGCALAIEEVFREAGFPAGLFRSVLVDLELTSAIIEHPLIRGVTLTGSVRAGKAVASQAGDQVKKTVLELGGSDPYIILEDADLDATVETCATSRMLNSGQSCIAAKRFLVVEPLREEFERRLVARMGQAVMGDPMDEKTTLGPQARPDLRDELHQQVRESVEAGARLLLGGELPEGPGAFYPATVLTDVAPGMRAYHEELFGPVATIIGVADEAEAVRVANDTVFGLGAAVFTADRQRGERLAREELDAGACFVNAFVRSDPRLPFGGVKESGYGRELSPFGIREFVNIKTVWVQ